MSKLIMFCSIDTTESTRLGRFINHHKKLANCNLRTLHLGQDNPPIAALFANRTIEVREELAYDYGVPLNRFAVIICILFLHAFYVYLY